MKNTQGERSSATVVIGMVVAIFFLGMLMLVVVVGGGVFYARSVQFELRQAQVAEMEAIAAVQEAEARAAFAAKAAAAEKEADIDVAIALDSDGQVMIDNSPLSRDELRELLLARKASSSPLIVQIQASADCAVKDLAPVLDVCGSIEGVKFHVATRPDR